LPVPVVSSGADRKVEDDNDNEHEPEKNGERRLAETPIRFSLNAELLATDTGDWQLALAPENQISLKGS
jgi:hypothetical protein